MQNVDQSRRYIGLLTTNTLKGFDTVGFGRICYCWFWWGLIIFVLVRFDMDLLKYFGWYDDTLVWFFIV